MAPERYQERLADHPSEVAVRRLLRVLIGIALIMAAVGICMAIAGNIDMAKHSGDPQTDTCESCDENGYCYPYTCAKAYEDAQSVYAAGTALIITGFGPLGGTAGVMLLCQTHVYSFEKRSDKPSERKYKG